MKTRYFKDILHLYIYIYIYMYLSIYIYIIDSWPDWNITGILNGILEVDLMVYYRYIRGRLMVYKMVC